MRLANCLHVFEHFLLERARRRRLSRMQQLPHRLRQKSVRVQVVFFDVERRILPLEIAGAISDDAVPEYQVLRARRRPNRIGLHESEPIDGSLQRRGWEE